MIQIGTSGWDYPHWLGRFYPPELPHRDQLPYYAARFVTVEINRSFYRLPDRSTFAAWAEQVAFRPDFFFAVKASRYLTHLKKLKEPAEGLRRLIDAAEGLGARLGPFLYQLPPRWKANPERLAEFLGMLPRRYRHAFEFRDPSWFAPEILHLLDDNGCALVTAVGGPHHTPLDLPGAGPFRYLRFHGGLYGIGYTEGELAFWAERIRAEASGGRDVYVYFNNDPEGHAVRDAERLRSMLDKS